MPLPIPSILGSRFSSDGDYIISGSVTGLIIVWDLAHGKRICHLTGHKKRIRCLSVLSEARAISSSDDKTMRVWSLTTDTCLQVLEITDNLVNKLEVGGSGSHIFLGCLSGRVGAWDPVGGSCTQSQLDETEAAVTALVVLGQELVEASGCFNVDSFGSHAVQRIETPAPTMLLSGHADGSLRLWSHHAGGMTPLCCTHIFGHAVLQLICWRSNIVIAGKEGGLPEDVCGLDAKVFRLELTKYLASVKSIRENSKEKNIDSKHFDVMQIGMQTQGIWALRSWSDRLAVVQKRQNKAVIDIWAES